MSLQNTPVENGYELVGFESDKEEKEFFAILQVYDSNNEKIQKNFKINHPKEFDGNFFVLMKKYGLVSQYHVVDENNELFVYQNDLDEQIASFRPFSLLPPNLRKANQWEYDKYCYYDSDTSFKNENNFVDMNALVYESFLKNKE